MLLEMKYDGRLNFGFMVQISTFPGRTVKRLPDSNMAGEAAAGEWIGVNNHPHFIRRTASKSKVSANACQLRAVTHRH